MLKSLSVIYKLLLLSLLLFAVLVSVQSVAEAEVKESRDSLAELGQPEVKVEDYIFEFGAVAEGDVVSHTFTISNTGNAPLLITSLNAACGCTSTVLDSTELAPGEQGKIEVKFKTEGFFGDKEKTVRVNTNDPNTPSFVLTLRGTVQRDVAATPARIFWGKVKRGTTLSQEVVISDASGRIKITEVSSNSEYLKVERESSSNSFTVALSKDLPLGVLRGDIVVKTTSKHRPVITVPVFARAQGDLELFPSDVSFGLVDPLSSNGALSKKVILRNLSRAAINVLEVESDNSSVEASAAPGGADDEKVITVTLKEGAKGVIKAKIKLITDHADSEQREVLIPVYAIIAKPKE